MTSILDINDCALTLFDGGNRLYSEPAVALIQNKNILFGDAALRRARIHPQQANQQYLARLNADPLPHPTNLAANHADLVYLHLKELTAMADELLLAVPGIMSSDQLGVLLGIAQEAGVNVCGFVDTAVASAGTCALAPVTHHVELHLHRACVSTLKVNEQIQRVSAEEIPESGFANLLDAWVNVIADRFVRDTRFDPLHAAESEQQLYDQVYEWVLGPGSSMQPTPAAEIAIDIDHQNYVRHVDVPRTVLEDKATQRLQRLLDTLPSGAHVTLSARDAGLPGLRAALRHAGHSITELPADALAAACQQHEARMRSSGDGLRLVTSLPNGNRLTESSPAESAVRRPTHLLNRASAHAGAVDANPPEQPFAIERRGDGVHLRTAEASVSLNGERPAPDALLHSGDEIAHGGARYLLIAVEG